MADRPLWQRIVDAIKNERPLTPDEEFGFPGRRVDGDPVQIDDGGGYPYEDTRPDFVQKDDEGWVRLR